MKKNTTKVDVWNDDVPALDLAPSTVPEVLDDDYMPEVTEDLIPTEALRPQAIEYSIDGLKEDFPTARELEQFVFDETQVSLKLKGIDPAKKYEIAYAVLTGKDVDIKYITGANPYLDNTDLIPEDQLRPIPRRDPKLPNEEPMSIFSDMSVPHPDKDMRQLDAKVTCVFRTYRNGAISFEIMGPLEKHSVGEKLDKYGRSRPEKMTWVDPRTGEQAVRYSDGTFTRMGQRLRTLMESKRVNRNQSVWSIWIDRDFINFNQDALDNPWGDE